MTEPSMAKQDFSPVEQRLRGKIAELFEDAREEGVILKWADGFTDAGQVLDLIRETFPELAKEAGYKSPEDCKACEAVFRGAQEASIETVHGLYEVVRERAE